MRQKLEINVEYSREIECAQQIYINKHPLFGFEHGYRVMLNATRISDLIKIPHKRKIALVASLFHDVGFFGENALIEHGPKSRTILEPHLASMGYLENEIENIVLATTRHSRPAWNKFGSPESLEEKIVFDSDQIEWINIQGILKFLEISKLNNVPYMEFYKSLPVDLIKRYNAIFLKETKIIVNPNLLNVMKMLGIKPNDFLAKPEVFEITETYLPTKFGDYMLRGYIANFDDTEALAIIKKTNPAQDNHLLRIHSECLTGEVLYSDRCDCRIQLKHAMQLLQKVENGVVIYLRQEGRGIGLMNKLKAYHLQDNGFDTVDANLELGFDVDQRDYKIAAMILKEMGIKEVDLITNNPAKIESLERYGIRVATRIPTERSFSIYCSKYLETKKQRMGHILP